MMRIGHGFDVHRLVAGRPLMLGGVQIPHEYGLLGHSDADVLLHAVADAILGALALGDIGRHFPDSDPAYKDADSMLLLKDVIALAESHGYRVGNLDTTIVAQQPKLLPYLEQMVNNLARVCKVSSENINVKATTTEELGYTGRGEGISTHAVVLMTAVG